jgi:sigma-54 specific flagellar transcriptional regulator A
MVARGGFREDLYYRLRGVVLEVPALRQRIQDLPLVAESLLARIAGERGTPVKRLSPSAVAGLARHTWPGNVRELENALRAAALFAEGDLLELEDFTCNVEGLACLAPAPVNGASPRLGSVAPGETSADCGNGTERAPNDLPMTQPSKIALSATEAAYAAIRAGVCLSDLKRDIERDCIVRALAETGGNITRAAGLLGMKRPRLSQLVKQYGLGSSSAVEADAEVNAEDGE